MTCGGHLHGGDNGATLVMVEMGEADGRFCKEQCHATVAVLGRGSMGVVGTGP